ncbi:hypothetical protein CBR_g12570 [Chara braunii]|uniref:Uncharacterized protein n=1 Tax=Chara braunii TaxID=69332 RepID=A0A388KS04_CHABU|nr:hypothetical protein CBR_g12570 [Chara braunii]|eukprot:GBG72850.1 hypothetical protein CBR_g12570 [Chara braunii]
MEPLPRCTGSAGAGAVPYGVAAVPVATAFVGSAGAGAVPYGVAAVPVATAFVFRALVGHGRGDTAAVAGRPVVSGGRAAVATEGGCDAGFVVAVSGCPAGVVFGLERAVHVVVDEIALPHNPVALVVVVAAPAIAFAVYAYGVHVAVVDADIVGIAQRDKELLQLLFVQLLLLLLVLLLAPFQFQLLLQPLLLPYLCLVLMVPLLVLRSRCVVLLLCLDCPLLVRAVAILGRAGFAASGGRPGAGFAIAPVTVVAGSGALPAAWAVGLVVTRSPLFLGEDASSLLAVWAGPGVLAAAWAVGPDVVRSLLPHPGREEHRARAPPLVCRGMYGARGLWVQSPRHLGHGSSQFNPPLAE